MIQVKDLEADVVDVCNMSCEGCSHEVSRFRKSTYEFKKFADDVYTLSKVLHTYQFTIVGGSRSFSVMLLSTMPRSFAIRE